MTLDSVSSKGHRSWNRKLKVHLDIADSSCYQVIKNRKRITELAGLIDINCQEEIVMQLHRLKKSRAFSRVPSSNPIFSDKC